jgi:hypothetical protein
MSGSTFLIMFNSRIRDIKGKELSLLAPHWSIPPLGNWHYWLFTQIRRCFPIQLCPFCLEPKKTKGPSPFNPFYLFSLKNNHISTKYASLFHFKLSSSNWLSYFLTSPSSRPAPNPNRGLRPTIDKGPGSTFLGTNLDWFEANWLLELDNTSVPSLILGSPKQELSF